MRAKLYLLLISTLTLNLPSSGQISVVKSEYKGREAYALQNSNMRITMLSGGAYIAEIRLLFPDGSESVNPMFNPHYRTIDPDDYQPDSHRDLYGLGRNAKLMAGYMGHYLCFPYFGGSLSESEEQLGYSTHGEAFTVKYQVVEEQEEDGAKLTATAILPMTKFQVSRTLSLMPGQSVVLVEEEIENQQPFERPYHYVQHVTFGKPFVAFSKTRVDAPVSRIAFSAKQEDQSSLNQVEWPIVKVENGESIDAGLFSSDKGEGLYRAWLMDPDRLYSWFTMYNADLNLLVGYIFSKEENPWIGDWHENHRSQVLPRNGKTVAWGLEVGTTPFGSGISSIEQEPVFDTETYRLIGARERKKQSYLIFITAIDQVFRGVEELELEEGSIIISEKGSGRKMRLANAFGPPR